MHENHYDIAIIGGGLAGLALSIQSANDGYRTILFEKEHFPHQKVCGEYISMESYGFLESLGIPLRDMRLPMIRKLMVSAPNGSYLEQPLPLGGFGISRFTLDAMLASLARNKMVTVLEDTKAEYAHFTGDAFIIDAGNRRYTSSILVSSFGKRSNLDIKWKRPFTQSKPNKLNHYIGVKYHIKTDHPAELIALHNFTNGYCGISQIEDGKCCLCYLTTAENLKHHGNSIKKMEESLLSMNPFLKKIFTNASFLFDSPVTISQISFDKKEQVSDHMLMVGDAAGMITPLCGNGMSMALLGSKIAYSCINDFLTNKVSREAMENSYRREWQKQFSARLKTGRMIQSFFGNSTKTNLLIAVLRHFPFLTRKLVRLTHGKPF